MDTDFRIGDLVYSPKYKIVGEVVDKTYNLHGRNGFYKIIVCINREMSDQFRNSNNKNINSSEISVNIGEMCVNPNDIKLLDSSSIYNKNTVRPKIIYGSLKKTDIKRGRKVRFVDNLIIEKMIKAVHYHDILSTSFSVRNFIGNTFILTGEYFNFTNGEIAVKIKSERTKETYYMYSDCLVLVKTNIFRKIYGKLNPNILYEIFKIFFNVSR